MTADADLWALDLTCDPCTGRELPCGAHLITKTEQGRFGEIRTAACGRTFTAGTHPRGWWSTRPGELPLAEHAVHCGADR